MLEAICLRILLLVASTHSREEDYWSENFDEEVNCRKADLIAGELTRNNQCEDVVTGNDTKAAFVNCKAQLQKKLLAACAATKISEVGELLYCKQRTNTICCFNKHTCVATWTKINAALYEPARQFLKQTEEALKAIQHAGYEKCYRIDGYDASKCAEDCEKAAAGDFAKNCTANGGFFKCCIRRDKKNCHNCRFCCSLLLCAYNTTQGVRNFGQVSLEEKDQKNKFSALDGFNSPPSMYKQEDYRCLKPDKSKKPEEWPHYIQEDIMQATTAAELEKARTIDFDINFMNFEDPDVLERMVGPEYKKYWKETYGFDWVRRPKPAVVDAHGNVKSDLTDLMMHCLKSELSEFAQKCRQDGGFYKCCGDALALSIFERVRVKLADENRSEKPKKLLCGKEFEEEGCHVTLATHLCTKKDILTAKLTTTFETPTQPKYEVGGNPFLDKEWTGFRVSACRLLNSCQNHGKLRAIPMLPYIKVYNKESFCDAAVNSTNIFQENATQLDTHRQSFEKHCTEQKVSSVFMCNDNSMLQDDQAKATTLKLRKFLEDKADEKTEKKKKDKKERKKERKKKEKKEGKKSKKKSKNKEKQD